MNKVFLVKRIIILSIVCYAFFFLGNSFIELTDPDEVFYALTAKEMATHQQWVTPYIFNQPQFEKPILTYYLLRIAFDIGDFTPYAARFFPALFAFLGVMGVYFFGLIGFKEEKKAFYTALVLCSAALYAGMARTVFTDMIFTVFILYALLSIYMAFKKRLDKAGGIILFFIFIALAILTKGPLALTIAEITVILFLLYVKQFNFLKTVWMPVGFVLCLLIAAPWYFHMYQLYGNNFIHEFFYNDHWRRVIEAEHRSNDTWYFYPLTIILGLFPWSLFTGLVFVELFKKLKNRLDGFEYFLISWIIVVFITFQFAHSKLASYIMPLFPPVALLTGSLIYEMIENNFKTKIAKIFIGIMASLILLLGILVVLGYPFYQQYIIFRDPIFFVSGALMTLGILSWVFLLRNQLFKSMSLIGIMPLITLWALFLLKEDIQPYISTYDSAQYVPAIKDGTTILTAKPYARGIKFFTNQNVSVLNMNGSNYFSPHPITIIVNQSQLEEYLKNQKVTYAVLKKSGYKTLNELPRTHYTVSLLKKIGYNFILKVESKS